METKKIVASDFTNTSVQLHYLLNQSQILKIHNEFEKSNMLLSEHKLQMALEQFNITFDSNYFHTLFQQIDTNSDGECSFDEFISFLMILFKLSDPNISNELLNQPIEGIPKRHPSNHLFAINRIRYYSLAIGKGGFYMTASKDGTISTWDSNFQWLRTNKSINPYLKANKTWILDFLYLENLRIICTASIECDLRFYNTRANSFQLCLIISNLLSAINCMHYWYPTTEIYSGKNSSRITLGDFAGNVIILSFDANDKRVFQYNSAGDFLNITWTDLLAGKMPLLHIQMLSKIHADTVTQVEYNASMNSIYSSAQYDLTVKQHNKYTGLAISDLGPSKSKAIYYIPRGVSSFAIGDSMVATGGSDSILRLWSNVITDKPIAIFSGHTAGINYIFAQDNFKRIYSLDKSKIIKVWDVVRQSLLQTYNGLATTMMDRCFLTAVYNDTDRKLIIAGMQVRSISCWPQLNADLTDGYTHTSTVAIALYNQLFNVIVTCGFDSSIINWNWENGERLTFIRNAHTTMFYGTLAPVEITAACFSPNAQFLLTAAGNGTLKMWNFNAGICIKNLSCSGNSEITHVFWLPSKILCVGWNRRITEFAVPAEQLHGHNWMKCHTEDILGSAVCENVIATGSFNGEVVIWKLDTGQPYKKYLVYSPKTNINVNEEDYATRDLKTRSINQKVVKDLNASKNSNKDRLSTNRHNRILSQVELPLELLKHSEISVNAIIFLSRRKMSPDHGTLVIALSNGMIQFYSHHILGTYIDSFNGIHKSGDSIVAMATDKNNEMLFTGTAFGYLKTWYILNYCVPAAEHQKIIMPEIRLQFPFLIRDLWEGRSKRSARSIDNPMLVNSYRAHMQTICALDYIDIHRVLISSSRDCSVRLWTLGGCYIQTLGSAVKHKKLTDKLKMNNGIVHRVPPDIKAGASSTTIKVLGAAANMDTMKTFIQHPKRKPKLSNNGNDENFENSRNTTTMNAQHLDDNTLGKYFQARPSVCSTIKPKIDIALPIVPVYKHLDISKPKLMCDIAHLPIDNKQRCFDLTQNN